MSTSVGIFRYGDHGGRSPSQNAELVREPIRRVNTRRPTVDLQIVSDSS